MYILSIDHGTSGIKCGIFDGKAQAVDFEFERTETLYLEDGGIEQDPQTWWDAIVKTASALTKRNPEIAKEIKAVSVSSTFSTTVAVNHDGEPICNALTWMDSRGEVAVKELMSGAVNVLGYSVGNLMAFLPKTGGAPTLSGKDDIAHVLFWKKNRPDVYNRAFKFLSSKDYINLKLSGDYVGTYESVTLFWLTDNRDINRIDYDKKLIKKLGLDPDHYPDLQPATSMIGPILEDVAEQLGIPKGCSVCAGVADLQGAGVGSGAVLDYEPHLYIGTSSWLTAHIPFKKTDVLHNIASLPSALPGKYFSCNEQDLAGGALNFFIRNIMYPDRNLEEIPMDIYEDVFDRAGKIPAGSGKVVFTPWLNGERTPVDEKFLRGGFHNISLKTTRDHMLRAVLEGVALNSRWVFKHLQDFLDRKISSLRIVGGGAKSKLWCQIFADVLGVTVHQVKNPLKSNARGAALLALMAMDKVKVYEIPDLVKIEDSFKPNFQNKATYDRLFEEFLNIYHQNKGIYKSLYED